MVKVLMQDFLHRDYHTEAHFVNFHEFVDEPFMLPAPLRPDFPQPMIRMEQFEPNSDYFEVGSMKLVSEQFRQELLRLNANMNFIDVQLFDRYGRLYDATKFFFAHLLVELDCFDYDRSLYRKRRNYVMHVQRLALREDKVGEEPVFRIANVALGDWFVSDKCAQHIASTNLRGILFLNLDEFSKRFG
jgi:hypothetical protein